MGKLKYVVKIFQDDRLLASESEETTDELMTLVREREYEIPMRITKLGEKVSKKAIDTYNNSIK